MARLVGAQHKCVLPRSCALFVHREGKYRSCRTSTSHRFVSDLQSLKSRWEARFVGALVYGSEYRASLSSHLSLTVPTDRCHIDRPDGLGLKVLSKS